MKSIQLVQLNIKYGDQVYLPYSIGILQSYVNQNEIIRKNFKFNEFLFIRENLDKMLEKIGNTDVLGISCYTWNWEISLKLAEKVKENNPNCLVFLGGPQVPNEINDIFFEEHNFVDILFHGEGEKTLEEVLLALQGNNSFKSIIGTTYYDYKEKKIYKNSRRERIKDYLSIPSPYLNGIFETVLLKYDYKWMATWETNRGCPFKCTFCDWGSATTGKLYKFDEKRLFDEIDYFTNKKFELIFGADANFGILKRDLELTKKLAENKKKFGYPNQFRVCFTKNSTEQVFNLAKIFSDAGMNKGVSVSMQSLDLNTLKNIKRDNINISFFNDLQKKYVKADLVSYTELILPLPGENNESFIEGIDNLLDSSQHSGIIVYNSSVMPNAELGNLDYQKKHGIKTIKVPILQAHSNFIKNHDDGINEFEEIVIETDTMSVSDWKKTYKYSIFIQAMHVLGLCQIISIILRYDFGLKYSNFYNAILDYGLKNPNTVIGTELFHLEDLLNNVLKGSGFDQKVEEFENITWPPEEAMFLRILNKLDQFYVEIREIVNDLVPNNNTKNNLIDEIFKFQKNILYHYNDEEVKEIITNYDIGNHFKKLRSGNLSDMKNGKFLNLIKPKKKFDSKKNYSREVVWYGRKGGKFFHSYEVKQIH